ncbi:PREDICTED: uncharacterized protein LOC106816583 [Priapulus caudatus]|uniref:Uncharacterized protein LOC106816583 n=1 Tax=Priapulus caudatus TaxID=37621 RepID=A0ABM1EWX0_PRICU|nr:PREDICTED: uncharacterized protein LOC106816583 [Priapulus caudatus]
MLSKTECDSWEQNSTELDQYDLKFVILSISAYCHTNENFTNEDCQGNHSATDMVGLNISWSMLNENSDAVLLHLWNAGNDTRYQDEGEVCVLFDFSNSTSLLHMPLEFAYDCLTSLVSLETYVVRLTTALPERQHVTFYVTPPQAANMYPPLAEMSAWQPTISVSNNTGASVDVIFGTCSLGYFNYYVVTATYDSQSTYDWEAQCRPLEAVVQPHEMNVSSLQTTVKLPAGHYRIHVRGSVDGIEALGDGSMSPWVTVTATSACPTQDTPIAMIVAVIVGVVALVGIAVTVILIVRRSLSGKQTASDPTVFFIYSNDHPVHSKVVEDLAALMERRCQCRVILDKWHCSHTDHNAILWQQQQLRGADFVVCVASTGTKFKEHANRLRGQPVDGVRTDMFATAMDQLRTLPCGHSTDDSPLLRAADDKFVNVYFEYSNKDEIPRQLETRATFRLMAEFPLLLQHVHRRRRRRWRPLAAATSASSHLSLPEGRDLSAAVAAARVFFRENRNWFVDKLQEELENGEAAAAAGDAPPRDPAATPGSEVGAHGGDGPANAGCPCPECARRRCRGDGSTSGSTDADCDDIDLSPGANLISATDAGATCWVDLHPFRDPGVFRYPECSCVSEEPVESQTTLLGCRGDDDGVCDDSARTYPFSSYSCGNGSPFAGAWGCVSYDASNKDAPLLSCDFEMQDVH